MGRTRSREVPTTIVDAAGRVLADTGSRGLTTRAVAAEAGVSVQSIYNRFGSFEAVIDDLVNQGFRDLTAALLDLHLAPLAEVGGPLTTLVEAMRRYRRFGLDHPAMWRLMLDTDRSARTDRTNRTAEQAVGVIVAVAANAVAAGVLLPGPPPLVARRLLAVAHGSIELEQAGWGPAHRSSQHDAAVATMIRGLRPRAQLR